MRAKPWYLLFTFLFLVTAISAQTIPVTFHFTPPVEEFENVRIAGTFNNWNNDLDDYELFDEDNDGKYEITIDLALEVEHNYKFVLDADWGKAFGDPDNPNINTADNNNSIMYVTDPMISYLLPRDVNDLDEKYIDASDDGEPIRVILAYSSENAPDPGTFVLSLDGNEIANPAQYFDSEKRELVYYPDPPLETGEHTVTFSAGTGDNIISASSDFIRDPDFNAVVYPVDFYFDSNSKSRFNFALDITGASVMGEFNNWNNQFNRMEDPDGDGVWHNRAEIKAGTYEYKFQLNGSFWLNDFDNPVISPVGDLNNLVTAEPDSIPSIKLIQPGEGRIYNAAEPEIIVSFEAELQPGTAGGAVNKSSIEFKVDGTSNSYSFNETNRKLSSSLLLSGEGIHRFYVKFANEKGIYTEQTFSYGIYPKDEGFYYVDAVNDEMYDYPANTDFGSADIEYVKILPSPANDSLVFHIGIKDLTGQTRIGLQISNIDNDYAPDSRALELLLPDWQDNGIFLSVAPEESPLYNSDRENVIQISRDPEEFGSERIHVNPDATDKNEFVFTISLAYLDSLMGPWAYERYFNLFSYIAGDAQGNGLEIPELLGGESIDDEPDIYDAVFVRNAFWQNRILSNYIPAGDPLGPMVSALDGKGRGLRTINASDISDHLIVYGPVITLLTPSAEYWYDNLTVHGKINDTEITEAKLYVNETEHVITVSEGEFSEEITLEEGENEVYVTATDGEGYSSNSRVKIYTYKKDHMPTVTIETGISGSDITLTAHGVSPDGLGLTYEWTERDSNPDGVSMSGTGNTASVTLPETDGEYYFKVTVTDTEDRKVSAERLLRVEPTDTGDKLVYLVDGNKHADWVDKAIIYEIFPRSFSEQGGFNGIADKVDYIKDLGVNTVWLMPIFRGPTTHGYEITDYYALEEDYGTEEDFRNLIKTLHDNGIKIILDQVVNHTSVRHRFIQNVFEAKGYSPYADWYIWLGEPGESNYQYYFDWHSLPNLNMNNEDVRNYFIEASEYWVRNFDIDGYRCDVAWGVEERNHDFWIAWRDSLKNIRPDLYLLAEASSAEPVFYQDRFESAYDWDLRNIMINAFNGTESINNLDAQLRKSYPENARPFRFIENHDEARIASTHDIARSKLAHTLLFTSNGIPLIYSGAEVGETTMRDPIDWTDEELSFPYFRGLTEIHTKYVKNPELDRIPNSEPMDVYSYASVSDTSTLVTVANFRKVNKTVELEAPEITETHYLTDLYSGKVITLEPDGADPEISLYPYQARVFYYGTDSLDVIVGVDEITNEVPKEYTLGQNYPNPFNPATTINFSLVEQGKVTLKIYDILGREVATLVNKEMLPGRHRVDFNASGLASGVYIYRLQTGKFSDVKKMILLK